MTDYSSPSLSVVHFFADWAEQCAQVNDVLDALSSQPDLKEAKFYRCPAEDLSEVSLRHKIEAVPTVVFFRSGAEVDRVNGADAAKITAKAKELAKGGTIDNKEPSLEERLKGLINRSKVMLFMKGDRSSPRCGFSKQIVQILGDIGYVVVFAFLCLVEGNILYGASHIKIFRLK